MLHVHQTSTIGHGQLGPRRTDAGCQPRHDEAKLTVRNCSTFSGIAPPPDLASRLSARRHRCLVKISGFADRCELYTKLVEWTEETNSIPQASRNKESRCSPKRGCRLPPVPPRCWSALAQKNNWHARLWQKQSSTCSLARGPSGSDITCETHITPPFPTTPRYLACLSFTASSPVYPAGPNPRQRLYRNENNACRTAECPPPTILSATSTSSGIRQPRLRSETHCR